MALAPYRQLDSRRKLKKGQFAWPASGSAIANSRDEGVTKLLFDDSSKSHGHGEILGSGMVDTHAVDIGKTIHPHFALGESISVTAESAHGSCTDVSPARK